MNGKERVYYEKNYKLVVAVGSTVSPFFTEVDEIHTSVGLWTNHTVWSVGRIGLTAGFSFCSKS